MQAAAHQPHVHARLLITFWMLAERWGTVERDGVLVTLPLTHQLIATLVGCQRASVAAALRRLDRAGLLVRAAPRSVAADR